MDGRINPHWTPGTTVEYGPVYIAGHWGVTTEAVTVATEAAHGGWVARAAVDLGHRVERFSEAGTTEARALERLSEASEHRAANARAMADWRAGNRPVPAAVG